MTSMKRVLLTTITMFAFGAAMPSAIAADLPRRPVTKAPVVAPLPHYNWTGFYVGINGGGGFGRSSFNSPNATTGNFNVSGGLVGGTIGYNYQMGQTVFGIEGDMDWAHIKGSHACAVTFVCQTQSHWLGTVRGRVGYAYDRFLPYVTGGLAVGDIKADTVGFGTASNTTKTGWTLGAGVETQITGAWSAKVEYDHVDLGTTTCGVNCIPATAMQPTRVKLNENLFRLGVNYRF